MSNRYKRGYYTVEGFDGYWKARDLLASYTPHRIQRTVKGKDAALEAAQKFLASHPPDESTTTRGEAYVMVTDSRGDRKALWKPDGPQWAEQFNFLKPKRSKKNPDEFTWEKRDGNWELTVFDPLYPEAGGRLYTLIKQGQRRGFPKGFYAVELTEFAGRQTHSTGLPSIDTTSLKTAKRKVEEMAREDSSNPRNANAIKRRLLNPKGHME